jgi:hypothetical protein
MPLRNFFEKYFLKKKEGRLESTLPVLVLHSARRPIQRYECFLDKQFFFESFLKLFFQSLKFQTYFFIVH